MTKPHKLSNSKVDITTSLEPKRMAEIAVEVAEGIKHVRFEGSSEGVVHFSLHDRFPRTLETMTFDVKVSGVDNITHAVTSIGRYHMKQREFLLGRELESYKVYHRFMDELAGAVRLADPSSTAVVNERPIA
jgi:hypothetical protein